MNGAGSTAHRFKSVSGAENYYNYLAGIIRKRGDEVPHTAVGDESVVVEYVVSDTYKWDVIECIFRKWNFVVQLISCDGFSTSEVIGFMQVVEGMVQ